MATWSGVCALGRADEYRQQYGRHRDREQQVRQAQHEVDDPGEGPVDPAAEEAGQQADHHADDRGDDRGRGGDDQRRAGTVDEAGEQVAAEAGLHAEPVLAVRADDREAVLVDEVLVQGRGVLALELGQQRREDRDQHEDQHDHGADHRHACPCGAGRARSRSATCPGSGRAFTAVRWNAGSVNRSLPAVTEASSISGSTSITSGTRSQATSMPHGRRYWCRCGGKVVGNSPVGNELTHRMNNSPLKVTEPMADVTTGRADARQPPSQDRANRGDSQRQIRRCPGYPETQSGGGLAQSYESVSGFGMPIPFVTCFGVMPVTEWRAVARVLRLGRRARCSPTLRPPRITIRRPWH